MEEGIVKVTKARADRMIEDLKQVFDCVRLFSEEDVHKHVVRDGQIESCCYSFWGKNVPCGNCVTLAALETKSMRSKFEFNDSFICHVTAKYIEIDGKPYVLELIKKMDDDMLSDERSRDEILSRLDGYYDKLYRDVLTGVYNRRFYEEQIRYRRMNCGVAMLDLDDFKVYNDLQGHKMGDEILIAVAKTIKKTIGKQDTVIRYGGDEFLLVMPEISETEFLCVLQDVRNKVASINLPLYNGAPLTVSIGGVINRDGTVEEAVAVADRRMYRAKSKKNAIATEENDFALRDSGRSMILIVDDSELNRNILTSILEDDFDVIEASCGEECIDLLRRYGTEISCVLLDIMMPGIDGFGVLDYMSENHLLDDVPVITITGDESETTVRKAYEMGVSDFINRPFDAKVVYRRVFNTVKLYAKQRRLLSIVTRQMAENEKNSRLLVDILSQIVEFRNGESGAHVLHIHKLTQILLEQVVRMTDAYKLKYPDIALISMASSLQDIGKIAIDDKILNKPGKLTKEEFDIVKTHTTVGADILDGLAVYRDEPLIRYARAICRWHHERYDGSGYPDGLKGEEIPIAAQAVSVADVYDALVSARVYKKAYPHEVAIGMIRRGECGAFNPLLLQALDAVADKFRRATEESYGEVEGENDYE